MKKAKRITAILGVIILIALYLSTLVFALLGEEFIKMLMAAVGATIVIPVLLWAYTLIYRLRKDANRKQD
ncbi:hypothetical protein LQZ18_02280 [Lachnospiraceae bacterium ZAX-1]